MSLFAINASDGDAVAALQAGQIGHDMLRIIASTTLGAAMPNTDPPALSR